jgi:hypothetical protein
LENFPLSSFLPICATILSMTAGLFSGRSLAPFHNDVRRVAIDKKERVNKYEE